MEKLKYLLNCLENKHDMLESTNPAISKSSVGWHIEHSLLTITIIINDLKKSNPADYKKSFSMPRLLVFTMNKIPRGRGKSPNIVMPKNDISLLTLKTNLNAVKQKIDELNTLNPNNYFEHPYFGKLNLKPTIKFLEIHTKHHLKIINDIIKA